MAPAESDELDGHVQQLAQEMQDYIFQHFMRLLPSSKIILDETYKPPVQTQIDKKSRAGAIKDYYGSPVVISSSAKEMAAWLHSLPQATRDQIYELRWSASLTHMGPYTAMQRMSDLTDMIVKARDMSINIRLIKMKILYYNPNDMEWCSQWLNHVDTCFRWQRQTFVYVAGWKSPLWKGEAIREIV